MCVCACVCVCVSVSESFERLLVCVQGTRESKIFSVAALQGTAETSNLQSQDSALSACAHYMVSCCTGGSGSLEEDRVQ